MISDHFEQISYPSFAPSPNNSPPKLLTVLQQHEPNVHKITINLPQSFIESTIDDNFSHNQSIKSDLQQKQENNIQIFCRFKPTKSVPHIKHDTTMIDDGQNRYSFDFIFNKFVSQQQIFNTLAWRHLQSFFKGQNSTIFTYGPTGSGKTFTMFGNLKDKQQYGLVPRTLSTIFQKKSQEDQITCSILEIYNEKLIDLFDPLKQSIEGLKLKQINDNVVIQGLVEVKVENHHEVMDLIHFGYKDRKIATTYSNDCSSRSHTILFVYRTRLQGDKMVKNKLCFIDLAGSQKVRKSGVKGQHLQQTKKINLSLSCLGNVVSALTSTADHIPYRNSKLTRILKDSLTGQCKTSIITTCSLDKIDLSQTLSTIKFAIRAKKIKNKKRLFNQEYTPEQIIASLKKQLQQTKKELQYYKKKEQSVIDQQIIQKEQIPEQAVVLLPIKPSSFNCMKGSSRILRL